VANGGLAHGDGLIRVFVFQLAEIEADALGDLHRPFHRPRPFGKQSRHFIRGFEAPFGVGLQRQAGVRDGAFLAHAGEDVLQHPPLGAVVEHVVGGDERRAAPLG
jgi:hypothetical protein